MQSIGGGIGRKTGRGLSAGPVTTSSPVEDSICKSAISENPPDSRKSPSSNPILFNVRVFASFHDRRVFIRITRDECFPLLRRLLRRGLLLRTETKSRFASSSYLIHVCVCVFVRFTHLPALVTAIGCDVCCTIDLDVANSPSPASTFLQCN
jgi:hypothetical protein